MNKIFRVPLALFTAWAFVHAALTAPAMAQAASEATVSQGYVVPLPGGRGNAIVTAPATPTANGAPANVSVYGDPGGAYAKRYGQPAGNGGRTVPVVPGTLPQAQ
jgi:hypothetical protein